MALDPKDYCAAVKARAGKVYPDLVNSVALKNLPRDVAEAEGWPTYYMPEPCQNGHVSARFTANTQCVDCWRVKQGKPELYPRAKDRTYYTQRMPVPTAANGAPVIVAPAAAPEPSAADQKFLAKLDELRDFDAAATAVGTKRGLIEARASSNSVFRNALDDLCERRAIPRTRAPDPSAFKWTLEIERQLVRRYIDTGLIAAARDELGVAASDYQKRLSENSKFAELIEQARPLARETLRERGMQGAASGNDRLAKILEADPEVGIFTDVQGNKRHYVNPEQCRAEMTLLLDELRKKLGRREALAKAARDARERSNTLAAASNDDLVTA